MQKLHVKKIAEAKFPSKYGNFKIVAFIDSAGQEDVALIKGKLTSQPVLLRLHSKCLTGDTLGSLRCDCGEQLNKSLKLIAKAKQGVLLYLNQEGRGIGLANKIKAYALEDKGLDTVEANLALHFAADLRDYGVAAEMLKLLKISSVKLITNNPDKECQLTKYGINVVSSIPLEITPTKSNSRYLKTKKIKMGHRLTTV